ncbi:MAG: hypothetical protein ACRD7E_08625 [Bryobacteraceae bacterium]
MNKLASDPTAYEKPGCFFDQHFRGFCAEAMPVLDRLVLSRLLRCARILETPAQPRLPMRWR